MISQFFADHELYLNFLEISESNIPIKDGKVDKPEFLKLVEKQFRILTRKYHSDFGGNDESFKFLLKCKHVFLDSEINNNFSLNLFDDKFLEFDKNTIAAKVGDQIFELISSWSDILNIKPIFRPHQISDCYEWIFNTEEEGTQLCLNVQNLTNEYEEISSANYGHDNLNVLVCIFVPSKRLTVNNIQYDNSVELKFNDKIFLESSNSLSISEYLATPDNIKNDLCKVFRGTFTSKENEIKVKNASASIKADAKVLKYLEDIKLFSTIQNDSAADFLDKL